MTKQEFKTKINKIMDEAIKIDRINSIVEDMEFTMKKQDDLSDIARDALVIGYAEDPVHLASPARAQVCSR